MANEVTLVADVNGTLVSWTDGYFSCKDRVLLNEIKKVCKQGENGVLPAVQIFADRHDPDGGYVPHGGYALGASAAIAFVGRGRVRFLTPSPGLVDYRELLEPFESYVSTSLSQQDEPVSS